MIDCKYDDVFSFENIYKAHLRARLAKRDKKPIVKFEFNMLENLRKLFLELKQREFKIRRYHSFVVFEPKKREIQTLDYNVRIVQHILCDDILAPYFTKKVILDNCVCQKGKGLHFALARFEKMLRTYIRQNGDDVWVLKCDIKKYFASIPHEKLKKVICKHIKDKDIRTLIEDVIDSYHTNPEYLAKNNIKPLTENKNNDVIIINQNSKSESKKNQHEKIVSTGRGIPIGNQTSQIFGMFYLDSLDCFIKEKLKIKIYSRYMDDFILIDKDKAVIERAYDEIKKKVSELGLELNSKTQIFPLRNGVKYLGFRYYITPSGKLIKQVAKKTKKRMRWRVRLLKRAYADGTIDKERVKASLCAFHGHLKHANCFKLERELQEPLKEILKPLNKTEKQKGE